MKKKVYLFLLILLPVFALAQQVKLGVQGGFSLARTQSNSNIKFISQDYRLGPIVGVMAGMNLVSKLSIMAELNYVAKGFKFTGTDQSTAIPVSVKGTHTTHYVELPLSLLYYFNLGNGHFFVGAGPYAAMGIKAKNKITYQVDPSPEVEETFIKFGDGVNDIKRFDYGIHGSLGYKLGYGSYLKASYSYGLANLSNIPETKYDNKYFGLTFGYFFNSGR